MDRTIFWDENQSRTFDYVEDDVDKLISQANLSQDLLGGQTTVIGGLAASASGPTSLVIHLAAGRIYQVADIDATAIGGIPQNTSTVLQQGFSIAQTVTLSTTGITSGNSRYSLIQAQFSQVDSIRANDPNGGLLFFYNSTNPADPFEGPGNDGLTTPTVRQGLIVIQVINGAQASTGSEVPPNPTSGWVPLYMVDLAFGQTTISGGQILTAGPSVGLNVPSNYPYAPFLAGLLNSHHDGNAGQAPQISLTTEVQGVLPFANLKVSNTLGGLAAFRLFAGNPNGSVAGNANVNSASDMCYDTTHNILYVCTTTGTTSTAVWTAVTGGVASTEITTGTNHTFAAADSGLLVLRSNSGAFMLDTLPGTSPGVLSPNWRATIVNNDASALYSFTVGAGAQLNGISAGYVVLGGGQRCTVFSDGTNYWTTTMPDRIRLGASANFFVSTTGNDSNNGLTSATPWLTVSHALQTIASNYDLGQSVATVQLADGTYSAGCTLGVTFIGGQLGSVILQGNTVTPSNVLVSSSGTNAFYCARGMQLVVQYFKVAITSGNWGCFVCDQGATIQVGPGMVFGATTGVHFSALNGGRIIINNNYTISGGGLAHWAADYGAFISGTGLTITLSGTPAFSSAFATAADCSTLNVNGNTFSGSGATGPRYFSQTNSVINSGGGGASYLPGSSGGSVATQGLYV